MRACPNRGFKSRCMRPCPTRPHLQNTDSKTKGRTGVESASGLSSLSGKSRNTDFYVKVDFEILATNNLLLFFTKILPKKCLWAQFAQRPPVCRPGCEGCFSHFAPAAAELSVAPAVCVRCSARAGAKEAFSFVLLAPTIGQHGYLRNIW